MKLTPLDIHQKDFRSALRGYNPDEVDAFLDDVADELERLFKENIDLSERLDEASGRIRNYADMEKTLHNTMLAAQSSAEEIQVKARKEAELLLRDAEIKAKELIQGALADKQRATGEVMKLRAAEAQFRLAFRKLLEGYLQALIEIEVPADMAAVAAEAEQRVGDLQQAQTAAAPEPGPAPAPPVAQPTPPPAEPAPEPEQRPTATAGERPDAAGDATSGRPSARAGRRSGGTGQPTQAMDPVEVPTAGFVQSLTLGEVEGPDLRPDAPVFETPGVFGAGDDLHGERDDDLDIEQVD